jgi:hypothetical protein
MDITDILDPVHPREAQAEVSDQHDAASPDGQGGEQ